MFQYFDIKELIESVQILILHFRQIRSLSKTMPTYQCALHSLCFFFYGKFYLSQKYVVILY